MRLFSGGGKVVTSFRKLIILIKTKQKSVSSIQTEAKLWDLGTGIASQKGVLQKGVV